MLISTPFFSFLAFLLSVFLDSLGLLLAGLEIYFLAIDTSIKRNVLHLFNSFCIRKVLFGISHDQQFLLSFAT